MFGRIRLKFQCLERYGQNSNVWTDKFRIPIYGQIRSEFQCLDGSGKKSKVCKDKD